MDSLPTSVRSTESSSSSPETPSPKFELDAFSLDKSIQTLPSLFESILPKQLTANSIVLGKNKNKIDPNVNSHTSGIEMYRQDATCTIKDKNTLMSIIADGHGIMGDKFSKLTTERLIEHYNIDKNMLIGACIDNTITKLIQTWFQETQKYTIENLPKTEDYNISGTTVTLVIIAQCPISKRRFIIGANVGDTPAYYQQDGIIYPIFENHSVDSKEEYKRYVLRCQKNAKLPFDFVYNRINVFGGNPHPDPTITCTLPMYTWDPITQTVNLNEDSYEKLIAGFPYPGGIQSIHRDDSPEKKHENWGSTIAGRLQMTRTIGDINDKEMLFLDCVPFVTAKEIDTNLDCTYVIGSDGFFDGSKVSDTFSTINQYLNEDEEIDDDDKIDADDDDMVAAEDDMVPDDCEEVSKLTKICGELWVKLCLNLKEANDSFGCQMFPYVNGVPSHDDISLIICNTKSLS